MFTKRSDETEFQATYTPSDVAADALRDIGFPGEPPFTRGIHPNQYRGRLWTMRQYAGFASAEQTNARFLKLLELGQTGLSIAFDLPTQMGFDPDEGVSQGEVGRVGVSIATLDDMETVLKGIPLDQVSTSMTINATAPVLFAFYLAVAKRQGIPFSKLRGTLQNDVLKEYIARGTYIFPPQPSLRLTTDILEFCVKEVPQWNPLSISGYHIREAGSDAIQEVAFTLANACTYAQEALVRGLSFDTFAGQLSFFFASHTHVIEEVAKFRAARKLWAHLARSRFQATSAKAMMLRFHAQTGGSTLTAQQIDNNIVRTAIQALSAVLGGCQSLHTNGKDEALSLPTQESATLALRTQQLIAEESGVANTVDPVGGSYAFEAETQRIYEAAKALIQTVDDMGGSVKAVERQFFQQHIADRAYTYQKQIESGERKIVGVNCYTSQAETQAPAFVIDPKLEQASRDKIAAYKSRRDPAQVRQHLDVIQSVARSQTNLMPTLIEAVQAGLTLGEISHALREVFGVYRP